MLLLWQVNLIDEGHIDATSGLCRKFILDSMYHLGSGLSKLHQPHSNYQNVPRVRVPNLNGDYGLHVHRRHFRQLLPTLPFEKSVWRDDF